MSKVIFRDPLHSDTSVPTVAPLSTDVEISVMDDDGKVQSRIRLSESSPVPTTPSGKPLKDPAPLITVLPESLPDWAMPHDIHMTTIQKTATYRCLDCGGEHE